MLFLFHTLRLTASGLPRSISLSLKYLKVTINSITALRLMGMGLMEAGKIKELKVNFVHIVY